jgi:hypothetical protein
MDHDRKALEEDGEARSFGLAPWDEGMRPDGTIPPVKPYFRMRLDDYRTTFGRWRCRLRRHRGMGAKG